jgi:hypothetical protein
MLRADVNGTLDLRIDLHWDCHWSVYSQSQAGNGGGVRQQTEFNTARPVITYWNHLSYSLCRLHAWNFVFHVNGVLGKT